MHTNVKFLSLAVFTAIGRHRLQWNHCSHRSQITHTPVFLVVHIGHRSLSIAGAAGEWLEDCKVLAAFLFWALGVEVGTGWCSAGLVFTVNGKTESIIQFNKQLTGLWQMFRTFVLRCDWSILRILKSTKKHERQSERVTLVSIYNNIFRLYHN